MHEQKVGNPYVSKLNPAQVEEIREKYATGKYKQEQLAREYNVCQQAISKVVRQESYCVL
ncbi:MAG: hypothetical protein ACYTF1_22195 [Planctomycetota bacterium]|jgi:DNA-binding transcriptional regulator YiaG